LSKARLKLLPGAFIELNYIPTTTFYQNNKKIKHFFGFIVFAIDGSKFQLPESDQLREIYGSSSNQTESRMVMSLVSQFVDVLSGIVLHALICPFNASERDLAITHVNYFISSRKNISCLSNSILLFDRGYPSVLLFSKLIYNNIHFLMRCNTAFLKEINYFGKV